MKALKAFALAIVILAIGAQVGQLTGGPGTPGGAVPFLVSIGLAIYAARWLLKQPDKSR